MKPSQILAEFALVAARKIALTTEQSYRVWINKYLAFLATPEARAAEAANVGGKVTPHCLRHSFCSHLLDSGENIKRVAEAMGHTDIRTTAGYGRKDCEQMRSPLDRIIQFPKSA